MDFKKFSVANVSVNRNVIDVPKNRERENEWKVQTHVNGLLWNSPDKKKNLHVIVTNVIILDENTIGRYDVQTVFELKKMWKEITNEERLGMVHFAYHVPIVMLLQQAYDEVASLPPMPFVNPEFFQKTVDGIRGPVD